MAKRLGLRSIVLVAGILSSATVYGTTSSSGQPPTQANNLDIPLTLSTHAAWSGTYVLNAALLAEYDARRLTFKDRAQELQQWFNSSEGRQLYIRARFALQAMTERSQSLANRSEWQRLLDEHASKLQPAVTSVNAQAVAATLTSDQRSSWEHWQVLYALPAPTCPLSAERVQKFVAGLEAASAKGGESAQATIARLQGWPAAKVRCLALTLSATHGLDKTKGPLLLLQALQVMDSPLMADSSIRAVFALTLLRHGNFPETLRVLMSMLDQQPAYRLPYEVVQRVFSIRHQGRGRVALQGL